MTEPITGQRLTDAQRAALAAIAEHERGVARALEVGFTEAQAPFAAVAAELHPGATVAQIREHLRATYPSLFEDQPDEKEKR